MDIRELRLFLHLAESCHFGKTAAAMYISPSTLSRQIQRLEESLGHQLFLRDNRTVQLTAAGEQLKKFAQETVLQYQQLQHALNHQSPSLTGELRLFCSVTAAYSHLPQILDQFRAEHPQVEIKLSITIFPSWNRLFSTPLGTPTDIILRTIPQSGRQDIPRCR